MMVWSERVHETARGPRPPSDRSSLGRRAEDDAGASLAELMMVLAMIGFIVGAAFALQSVVNKSTASGTTLAEGAQTIGDPLEFMSRIVMQARSVATSGTVRAPNGALVPLPSSVASQPGDYAVAVATDRVPFNGWWELNYFHIDSSSPSVLSWDCWTYNETNNNVGARRAYWEMSRSINNRSVGLPMLDFFGVDTSLRLTTPTAINSDLRYVNCSLAVPTSGGGWTKDSRFVALRN